MTVERQVAAQNGGPAGPQGGARATADGMALDQVHGRVPLSSLDQRGERQLEQTLVEREKPSGPVAILRSQRAKQRPVEIPSQPFGGTVSGQDRAAEMAR